MRHILSFPLAALGALALAVAACGPGPTPTTPKPGDDVGAPAAEAPDGGAHEGGAPENHLAENKRAFMDGCSKGGEGTGPFCECAWEAMRAAVGDAKLGTEGPTEKDLVESHPKVMAACKTKMPEPAVKEGFLLGCVGDRAEMKPYCECSWTEFKKEFTAGDLGDETVIQSEKFGAARVRVTKACGSKISERVVEDGFIKACARDPKLDKFCDCAWKELKKMASPAEIEAGLIDKDKVQTTLEKACGKLKPTK